MITSRCEMDPKIYATYALVLKLGIYPQRVVQLAKGADIIDTQLESILRHVVGRILADYWSLQYVIDPSEMLVKTDDVVNFIISHTQRSWWRKIKDWFRIYS